MLSDNTLSHLLSNPLLHTHHLNSINNLTITHWNINGINNKLKHFMAWKSYVKSHIYIITETHVSQKNINRLPNNFISSCNPTSKWGVSIFTDHPHVKLELVSKDDLGCVVVVKASYNSSFVYIVGFYCPPVWKTP